MYFIGCVGEVVLVVAVVLVEVVVLVVAVVLVVVVVLVEVVNEVERLKKHVIARNEAISSHANQQAGIYSVSDMLDHVHFVATITGLKSGRTFLSELRFVG